MKIIVDKEGRTAIQWSCDQALRIGGVNNLNSVNAILSSMTNEKKKEEVNEKVVKENKKVVSKEDKKQPEQKKAEGAL